MSSYRGSFLFHRGIISFFPTNCYFKEVIPFWTCHHGVKMAKYCQLQQTATFSLKPLLLPMGKSMTIFWFVLKLLLLPVEISQAFSQDSLKLLLFSWNKQPWFTSWKKVAVLMETSYMLSKISCPKSSTFKEILQWSLYFILGGSRWRAGKVVVRYEIRKK